jgi:hypothetical protein
MCSILWLQELEGFNVQLVDFYETVATSEQVGLQGVQSILQELLWKGGMETWFVRPQAPFVWHLYAGCSPSGGNGGPWHFWQEVGRWP